MKKVNRIFAAVICCVLFLASISTNVHAEEYTSEKNGLDVVFVMDYSGSMKSNDPEHIAKAMVKAFIDTVHSADIRIGFVSYNDRLLSTTSPVPVSTMEQRERLKLLIDASDYSGNTDIGLGLRNAKELIEQDTRRKKAIVLISDGESDLKGSMTGRVLENSEMDMAYVVEQCANQDIPIYTIAFGAYDGNAQGLAELSEQTGARSYAVESPENLIDILYGIFTTNMDYSIQEITAGVYAQGVQNIRIKLEEEYLDELDVLVISPQPIGNTEVLYGNQQIESVNLRNYAVAKITEIDGGIKELTIRLETQGTQELKIYLISYRNLTPVLEVSPSANKNTRLEYKVYFKDKNGAIISDEKFYDNFTCNLELLHEEGQNEGPQRLDTSVHNGVINGEAVLALSGTYYISGQLDDSMGSCFFSPVAISILNRKPAGELPKDETVAMFSGKKQYALAEYFNDPDGDPLTFALSEDSTPYVQAEIVEGILTVKAQKPGEQVLQLIVSDGEDENLYSWKITVPAIWHTYWWAILLGAAVIIAVLWKILYRPKPELLQIAEKKAGNRFAGRLDAYVTGLPEGEEEIPPLTFSMYKIKDSRICLGDLMKEYQTLSDRLELDKIYLIADEDRRMVLYHMSDAMVMIGNSIVCRQIQYSVSFGDIIYLASQDGAYELEVHYIAMIQ